MAEHSGEPDRRKWTRQEYTQAIGRLISDYVLQARNTAKENITCDDPFIMENLRIEGAEEIGKGQDGVTVFKGYADSLPVAVRRFPLSHVRMDNGIFNFLSANPHPYVVFPSRLEFDGEDGFLVEQLCNCSLQNLIEALWPSSGFTVFFADVPSAIEHKRRQSSAIGVKLWADNGDPTQTLPKLMRDVALGLEYLHCYHIVHGDIRPQNVFIVDDDKLLSAKISDTGINKAHATPEWKAPDLFNAGQRPTPESDVFSFGQVLYFCLTEGRPYRGDQDLSLVRAKREAYKLLTHLLSPVPHLRPAISDAVIHPTFWEPDMRMDFLSKLSNKVQRLKIEDPHGIFLKELSSKKPLIYAGTWDTKIPPHILASLSNAYVTYDYKNLEDLLLMVKNQWAHKHRFSKAIQALSNQPSEGLETFFTTRFPGLLIETYQWLPTSSKEIDALGGSSKEIILILIDH